MSNRRGQRVLTVFLEGLPGWALCGLGLVISLASLVADGLGVGGEPGVIGWKQLLGFTFGLAVVGLGVWIARLMIPTDPSIAATPLHHDLQREAETPGTVIYDSAALRLPFIHELTELARYRFLLWNLISRDLKVRYKRSVLGFLWAMINPLLTMTVLLIVFIQLFRFDIENYPIYILSGLLLWNLFAQGTSVAMRSMLDNSAIRKKIYVPASVFVAAAIGSALVNLAFATVPLLILTLAYGISPSWAWLFLPVPVIQTTLFAFGVGVIMAALTVFFADMLDIYEVLLNAFFYLVPIIYPLSILPATMVRLERLNPMFQYIDAFRRSLIDGSLPSALTFTLSSLFALALVAVGWSLFTRLSDQFIYRT